jgi:hypothetical protein
MERLIYNEATQQLLIELAEGNKCYWRYQDSKFGGLIPIGHKSFERIACDEDDAEYIEYGCSCYDNPWQLVEYMSNENNDLDKTDVVLFVGRHKGYGLDEEDIVEVEEESDVLYSLSLRDFYKFCANIDEDTYWNTYNVKEKFCSWIAD